MDEKTIRFFMSGLQDAVTDLISEEIGWCEGFCEKNPTHRQERERDRDLIVFGMQKVFSEMEKRWKVGKYGERNDQH